MRGALSRRGQWPTHLEAGLRLSTTGTFDVGPGGATFDRVTAHLRACERQDARGGGLSVGACLSAEGGALRGQGLRGGPLLTAQEDTVPWLGLGVTPEANWHLGRVFVHASGGPVFPLVRRSFVFERPAYLVHEVPWVTWSAAVGVGVAFR